jgi:hypothetical protein
MTWDGLRYDKEWAGYVAITGKKYNIMKKGMCAGIPHTGMLLLSQITELKRI